MSRAVYQWPIKWPSGQAKIAQRKKTNTYLYFFLKSKKNFKINWKIAFMSLLTNALSHVTLLTY